MENISKEVESNDIKIDKFFEVAKVIIYSIIGIVVFFIPVTIDNQTKTILHHITYKLQVNYRGLLQLSTIVYITLKNLLKQEYLCNNLYYHPTYKDQKIFVRNGALNILQDKRLCYT